MPKSSLRRRVIAAWRSSLFLPVTRISSPWIELTTFTLLSLRTLLISFDFSWAIPWTSLTSCLTVSPAAGLDFPYSNALKETPRLTSLLSRMSTTLDNLKSSSEIKTIISASSLMDDLLFLKSNRFASSFWAC